MDISDQGESSDALEATLESSDEEELNIPAKSKKRSKKRQRMTIYDEDDGSPEKDYSEDEDEEVSVSIETLKHQILGRPMETYSPNERSEEVDDSPTPNVNLRRELSCTICHELFYQPVSLHCGHSFCGQCLYWWQQNSASERTDDYGNCPTCRSPLLCDVGMLGVNTALRACLQALFLQDYKQRARAEKLVERRATAGENGGAHKGGYEKLTNAAEQPWKLIGIFKCRRSIVVDEQDQRMQLTLALNGLDSNSSIVWKDGKLTVSLCLVTMEEDEVADGGFPVTISNTDDENLIANKESILSIIEVKGQSESQSTPKPISRRALDSDGKVQFTIDTVDELYQEEACLTFHHLISGVEFQLQVPPANHDIPSTYKHPERNDNDEIGGPKRFLLDDVEESEDEVFSEDDDGFFVDDDVEEESEASDNQVCNVCQEGGEMIVCDGGDATEGCGKSFHVNCVNRSAVPPGDWICADCAMEFGLTETGVEGHEFSTGATEKEYTSSPPRVASDGDDDDDGSSSEGDAIFSDEEGFVRPKDDLADKPKQKSKRVLDDTDEE